jgi:hypothetical protein
MEGHQNSSKNNLVGGFSKWPLLNFGKIDEIYPLPISVPKLQNVHIILMIK